MTAFADKLYFVLAYTSVKAALPLMLAALIAVSSRRASASFRHLVWTLGLLGALGLPLLSLTLPQWQLPIKTSLGRKRPMPLAPLFSVPAPADAGQPNHGSLTRPDVSIPPAMPLPADDPQIPAASLPVSRAMLPRCVWALLVWALGAVVVLVRLCRGLLSLRSLRAASVAVSERMLAETLTTARRALPIHYPVEMRVGAVPGRVPVPLTWGAWRPVIVLPSEALNTWPIERTRAALLHELAHVRRQDWLLQMLAHLACAFYWFNPFVWFAARSMREESEVACDDLALSSGITPADYARHLLDVALGWRDGRKIGDGTVAMAQTPKIEGRLRAVLNEHLAHKPITRRTALGALFATLLVTLPLSMLRPSGAQGDTDSTIPTSNDHSSPATGQYKVQLLNGVTMELVGLSDQPWTETHWWNGAGVPLAHAPRDFGDEDETRLVSNQKFFNKHSPNMLVKDISHNAVNPSTIRFETTEPTGLGSQDPSSGGVPIVMHGTWAKNRNSIHLFWERPRIASGSLLLTLVFHITNPNKDTSIESSLDGLADGTVRYSIAHIISVSDDGKVFGSYVLLKRQIPGQADVAMNVAAGPWRTAASASAGKNSVLPAGGGAAFNFRTKVIHELTPQRVTRKIPSLTITDTFGSVARRVVAVDSHGALTPVEASDIPAPGPNHRLNIWLSTKEMRNVEEFRLQTRPYKRVEFRNIQLQPLATDNAPASAALPVMPRQAHGFLKFVYLKDVATDKYPSRPWSLIQVPDGHGGFTEDFIQTKMKYSRSLPDDSETKRAFANLLAQGLQQRPFTKLFALPQPLCDWTPMKKVYFTTDHGEKLLYFG